MNKGDLNVRCFSQFKNSYGKVRVELGFFQASCFKKHVRRRVMLLLTQLYTSLQSRRHVSFTYAPLVYRTRAIDIDFRGATVKEIRRLLWRLAPHQSNLYGWEILLVSSPVQSHFHNGNMF